MSDISEQSDILKMVTFQGTLASFSEKTLHLEDKRFDLPLFDSVLGIMIIAFDRIQSQTMSPAEGYIESLYNLEINHPNYKHYGYALHFEKLRDKSPEETTWQELQITQMKHDYDYHPDVVLPGKVHHLSHVVLHLGMTNGKLADSLLKQEELERRIENYIKSMVFAVKASTALNFVLPTNSVTSKPEISES